LSILQTALLLGVAYGLMALGIYISMRILNIPDITTDGSFTLGGAVTAVLTLQSTHPVAVAPVTFLAGAIAGAMTGWIHTRLKVNALLSGILVTTGLYSINLAVMGHLSSPSFACLITPLPINWYSCCSLRLLRRQRSRTSYRRTSDWRCAQPATTSR
jgi:ABC-type uncharacterized transport system permease subunit